MTPAIMGEAVLAGATAYVPKSASRQVLVDAIRIIMEGGTYMPAQAMAALRNAQSGRHPRDARRIADELTSRQQRVLTLAGRRVFEQAHRARSRHQRDHREGARVGDPEEAGRGQSGAGRDRGAAPCLQCKAAFRDQAGRRSIIARSFARFSGFSSTLRPRCCKRSRKAGSGSLVMITAGTTQSNSR